MSWLAWLSLCLDLTTGITRNHRRGPLFLDVNSQLRHLTMSADSCTRIGYKSQIEEQFLDELKISTG